MNTEKRQGLAFQPFEFLGQRLLGAEITDAVDRNLLTQSEREALRKGLLSDDEVTSLAASRFYESLSSASVHAADLVGPGIAACKEQTFFFVRASDWSCQCDVDVAALVQAHTGNRPLAALEHHDSASVVRLGPNHARAILGRCWADRRSSRCEVSHRGLEYLLEHC